MSTESAVRRTNTYWSREVLDERGRPQTASDPTWYLYSSVVNTTETAPEKDFNIRMGLGSVDGTGKTQAQETHELTVEYELERFPVDASGASIDPLGDAIERTADNELANTHSFLQVTQNSGLLERNTVHSKWFSRSDVAGGDHPTGTNPGAEGRPTRKNIYGRGGRPEEPTAGIDASDDPLVVVEYSYQFQMVRPYQIDQPTASSYLHVHSTDPNDTGIEVTLEAVDGATTEPITLDGADATTAVATSGTFDSLGAVWVPDDHDGTILVYDDDGSGTTAPGAPAQLLTFVKGAELYDYVDSDHGIPPVGAGSFDDGSSLERKQYAIGAEALWNGAPLADYHQGSSVSISNDMGEENATDTGLEMARQVGTREVTVETTVFGETASSDNLGAFVEGKEGEFILRLTDGDIVFPKAFRSEGAPAAKEAEEAILLPEQTIHALADDETGDPAIQFVRAQ